MFWKAGIMGNKRVAMKKVKKIFPLKHAIFREKSHFFNEKDPDIINFQFFLGNYISYWFI